MDLGKRYIFSTGFLCVLNITLLAGLLSNGARDVESSRRLIAPSETQKATISAVDQNLLQQDHLNTWRDLRTIDEVVRHNRVASVYSQRMQEWGPKLLKLNSPSQTLITQMDASAWAETKPHRALAMVMYYFIETMKSHSPQNDHKEIESLAVGIEDSSKFKYYYNSVVARQMVNKFMYEYMLKFSWYLLIKQYSKGFKADHKGALQSSIEQAIRVWKEKNPQPLQVEYTRHYRQYMRLIEILDPLAAAGIQNSDVIRKVDIRSISLRNARTFLSKYSTDPNKVHKNLVSISPSDTFRAIKFPLFGYPLDINGKESAAIEATVLDIWKSRGQNDVNFASEVIEISRSLPTARFPKGGDVFPQRVREMRGFRLLTTIYKQHKSPYSQMWNHVAKLVNLAAKLDKPDSEEQSILWQMIRAAFLSLSKDFGQGKCVKQIENSIMFYLFIKRIGEVLEAAVEFHFPTTPPEKRVSRSQFMMYYWCLMSHKKRGDHNKLAKTVKWMEFEVGRVYMDHLIASKKLNEFYSQIQLPREDGPRGLLVLGQERAMLPRSRIVKEVERRLRGGKKDPQNDRAALARPRGTNNELETIQHASKSSPGGQKFISDHKQYLIDKLNFEKFWGRSSQNPHLLNSYKGPVANSALIHMSFQRFAEKRKSVTASLEGPERDVAAGSKKKPRTESVVGSSSEGGGSHFPAVYAGPTTLLTDGTQSTLYRNNPMLKDTPTSQESRTGGRPSSILLVSGETSKKSGQHISPLNFEIPLENASGDRDFRFMLPDLNEPLTPVSRQEDHQKDAASDLSVHPSFWQYSGGVRPVIPGQQGYSPLSTRREEVPDLNM